MLILPLPRQHRSPDQGEQAMDLTLAKCGELGTSKERSSHKPTASAAALSFLEPPRNHLESFP
jgi:hypothetical protein